MEAIITLPAEVLAIAENVSVEKRSEVQTVLNIEEILNLHTQGIKTIPMRRVTFGHKRFYALSDPFRSYSGLTGALSHVTYKGNEDNKRVSRWRDSMIAHLGSIDKQEALLNSMADFGTIVHEVIVRAWQTGGVDWDEETKYAQEYFAKSAKKNGIEINIDVIQQQTFEYCKSAASLMQFLFDNVTEIYSIEGMCKSDELSIATPVDIVCKLKDGRTATLNIKTSGQISDHHREQVAMEKWLWNQTYPDCQTDITGVIRPKDWNVKKGVPTYELEILKPEKEEEILSDVLSRLRHAQRYCTYLTMPTHYYTFEGMTALGENPNIKQVPICDIIFNENFIN